MKSEDFYNEVLAVIDINKLATIIANKKIIDMKFNYIDNQLHQNINDYRVSVQLNKYKRYAEYNEHNHTMFHCIPFVVMMYTSYSLLIRNGKDAKLMAIKFLNSTYTNTLSKNEIDFIITGLECLCNNVPEYKYESEDMKKYILDYGLLFYVFLINKIITDDNNLGLLDYVSMIGNMVYGFNKNQILLDNETIAKKIIRANIKEVYVDISKKYDSSFIIKLLDCIIYHKTNEHLYSNYYYKIYNNNSIVSDVANNVYPYLSNMYTSTLPENLRNSWYMEDNDFVYNKDEENNVKEILEIIKILKGE